MDTIYALASARGKAGVAVIRISGPKAFEAAFVLVGELPPARRAVLRQLRSNSVVIDEALVLRFDRDASFTGEDVFEIQCHGSQAVIAAICAVLEGLPGLRMAEPGEFTRRALESGRIDLAQVEGLADLIDAETEAQRVQAQRVLSGAIGDKLAEWRQSMLRARALIEATIDFADEDVPVDVSPEVRGLIDGLIVALKAEISGSKVAERVRDGFEVAIVGAPNSGKSTLLNMLAGRRAALTSEVAGTTRDVIEVRMDLNGLAVTLLDTAGLRDTDDSLEAEGIKLAVERAHTADLRVFLLTEPTESLPIEPHADDLVVIGKADLKPGPGFRISGLSGEGVSDLVDRIAGILGRRAASAGVTTRARHRLAMQGAVDALEFGRIELNTPSYQAELVAERLRQAARSLESLIGSVDVELLLGEIFSQFCIGK